MIVAAGSTGTIVGNAPRADCSWRLVLALWIISVVPLLLFIGGPPVSRTQEARVLETARQMLGAGPQGWLIPVLNGEPRLKKPPLAYWMTAAAYKIAGRVSEGVGRVPNALLGWLALGAVYQIAKRHFDQTTALLSCLVLLGSFQFFRFTRLAETDAPAMLFITIAIGAIWRAASESRPGKWFHLAAAATALAILVKGAPAIFVLLFFVSFCAVEKRWPLLWRFVRCGAPITLLIVAVPWFAYVGHALHGGTIFVAELANTTAGSNHWGSPLQYVPALLVGTAPWSALLPIALYAAISKWKTSEPVRITLLWFASILITLCINGNKQNHYLIMLMPPTAMLIGSLMSRARGPMRALVAWVVFTTLLAFLAAGIAIPFVGDAVRGARLPLDWTVSLFVVVAAALALWAFGARGLFDGAFACAFATVATFPIIVGLWLGTLPRQTTRTLARQITIAFGDGPFVFYGPNTSLPLCFNLRKIIPSCETESDLLATARPGTVVISQTKPGFAPPPMPGEFEKALEVKLPEQTVDCYVTRSRSDDDATP